MQELPKLHKNCFFYHLRVESSYWRKYFAVEKHCYVQLYTSVQTSEYPQQGKYKGEVTNTIENGFASQLKQDYNKWNKAFFCLTSNSEEQ